MNDSLDDNDSMIPTLLDRERLETMKADECVQGEYGTWTVCRYPPKKHRPSWCEYTLMVNHPKLPSPGAGYELRSLKSLLSFMESLEAERRRS